MRANKSALCIAKDLIDKNAGGVGLINILKPKYFVIPLSVNETTPAMQFFNQFASRLNVDFTINPLRIEMLL
jgi:hypothetical protein